MRILLLLLVFAAAPLLAAAQDPASTSVRTVVAFSADRHGQVTADGARYDHYGFSAAHPTLPFGTRLHLKRLDDGRSVIVRVTDRPPDGFSLIVSGASGQTLGVLEESTLVEQVVLGAPPRPAAPRLASASDAVTVAARPPGASASRYTLQLAAFHDAHFAERFTERIEGARVETQVEDGTALHRVFVGDYATRAEAQASSEVLARRGFESLVKSRTLAL